LERDRVILRLAALLHDVGHSPFSHAGEDLMVLNPATGKAYKHENYSTEMIRAFMTDVIDDHRLNKRGFAVTADQVADFLEGKSRVGQGPLLWRELITSQLDADRADYLLRDSHHIGVEYGRYDLNRLVISLTIGLDEAENPVLAMNEGGWHTAESIIIARYMMFTQVYFHKTRIIYDHHIGEAFKDMLAEDQANTDLESKDAFPPPTSKADLEKYMAWDDWRALGLLHGGAGGEHGKIIRTRKHHRVVFGTPDNASEEDERNAESLKQRLGPLVAYHDNKAASTWYKLKGDEILVAKGLGESLTRRLVPLSEMSYVVQGLRASKRQRLYAALEDRERAKEIVRDFFLEKSKGET
jgi:uncharacterized protein